MSQNNDASKKAHYGTQLSPAEFAYFSLGMRNLYDWQIECLEAIGAQEKGGKPVAIAAANGSGKTAYIVAASIYWFLNRFPKGQVVITSGSFMQIETQLFPALKVYSTNFPNWRFLKTEIRTPDGGIAFGFSTDNAGRAEGHHPKMGKLIDPVFIIVDEAKTVDETIFEAFERCGRLFQLWVSSPGKPWGRFYDAFHSRRSRYWTRKITSLECEHIDPAKRQRDLEDLGEDHWLYRSMHLAEFTADAGRLIIPPEKLTKALDGQPPEDENGETVAFFDFAAGRDENVFALRRGNKVRIIKAWVEDDTVQAAREFIHIAKTLGVHASECWGDSDGLGTVIIDEMAEQGFFINRFYGGAPSTQPKDYINRAAEVWHVGATSILRGRINLGQIDPTTFKQLTTRQSEWTNDGRIRNESKEKMGKEGKKSPDRADAILGCIVCGSRFTDSVSGSVAKQAKIANNSFKTRVSNF